MSELRDLYQEVIIDHGRHPRNFRCLQEANKHAEGFNPLCGDRLTLYLKIEKDIIEDVTFQGSGCAISMASASLLTQAIKHKTLQEALDLFEKFHLLVTIGGQQDVGKLEILSGVREFPARVKCATLAWHTLHAALSEQKNVVTTEDI